MKSIKDSFTGGLKFKKANHANENETQRVATARIQELEVKLA